MLWTLWPPVACLRRNQSHQLYQYWQILLVAFIGIGHEIFVYEFDTPDLKYHFIHLFIYLFIFLESNWTESSCLWIIKLEIKCISIVLKYTFKFRFRISHCPTPLIGFFFFLQHFFTWKCWINVSKMIVSVASETLCGSRARWLDEMFESLT